MGSAGSSGWDGAGGLRPLLHRSLPESSSGKEIFQWGCQNDNWRDILLEEVFEALAEEEPKELRKELVQVAAVAAQWVEAIDRRGGSDA